MNAPGGGVAVDEENAINEATAETTESPFTPTSKRTVNFAVDTDMIDASDSMSERSPYWLDGSNDVDHATSAKPSTPSSKTKKRAKAAVADEGADGDAESTPMPKSANKTTPKKGIIRTPSSSAKMSSKRKAQLMENEGSEDDGTPTRKEGNLSGRIRRAPKNGILESSQIPLSYEECEESDRMLVDMRKNEEYTWPQVREAWFQLTGKRVGNSTLPNRLERLRANFSVIREEDRKYLLKAKIEVEREWEAEKWKKIALLVHNLGGDSYGDDHLRRQWKVMMEKEGLKPPTALYVHDWRDDSKDKVLSGGRKRKEKQQQDGGTIEE